MELTGPQVSRFSDSDEAFPTPGGNAGESWHIPTVKLVSIIVPHFSDLGGLDRCLAALEGQAQGPYDVEIIVADNQSPEGEEAVRAVVRGRARLVIVPERGAGPARNGAVAQSSGDLLAFTDADCIPDPDWLRRGVEALESYDFVGGGMRVLVEDEARLTGPEAFERVFAFDNADYVLRKRFTVTANLLCPRRVFDDVGGFRVGVPEDLDWCLRAGQKGYVIGYAPTAAVGHPARRTWYDLVRKRKRLDEEAFGLSRGTPNWRLKWLAAALAMPMSAVLHSPKVFSSRNLSTMDSRMRALATLYRIRFWRAGHYLRLLSR